MINFFFWVGDSYKHYRTDFRFNPVHALYRALFYEIMHRDPRTKANDAQKRPGAKTGE